MTSLTEKSIQIQIRLIPHLIRELLQRPPDKDYRIQKPLFFKSDDFKQNFLNPEEFQRLNQFKALKKQVEWLCGRFSAKAAAQELLMPDQRLDGVQIDYMEQGAPYIVAFPNHCLSLSHSGIYTAAAVAMEPGILTGIDIEALGPRPDHHFMKTAFTDKEIRHLGPSARDVFQCWTQKEAYLKYIRMGFNESLHQVEIINGRIYHRGVERDLDCRSWDLDQGYIMSGVFPPGTVVQLSIKLKPSKS